MNINGLYVEAFEIIIMLKSVFSEQQCCFLSFPIGSGKLLVQSWTGLLTVRLGAVEKAVISECHTFLNQS